MASEKGLWVDVRVEGPGDTPRLEARFSAPAGVTVLFGPSGAGKSTCLYAIAGLLRPSRGRISLGDEVLFGDGVDLPARRRRVALVFQSLALFPHLTALDNVAFGLTSARARAERRERAAQWLSRMRVEHVAARRPTRLSGGEAQRVALARALASEPLALLLDEPFSALDEGLRRELGAELLAQVRALGIPTLWVTHDREDARRVGDRVVKLRDGRVEATGSLELLGAASA